VSETPTKFETEKDATQRAIALLESIDDISRVELKIYETNKDDTKEPSQSQSANGSVTFQSGESDNDTEADAESDGVESSLAEDPADMPDIDDVEEMMEILKKIRNGRY
jgi:hypothetical protein